MKTNKEKKCSEKGLKSNIKKIEKDYLVSKILEEILKTYKSVYEFTQDTDAIKAAGLEKIPPQHLRVYLSSQGPTSFEVLQKLCKYFGLGELKREVKRVVITNYYLK